MDALLGIDCRQLGMSIGKFVKTNNSDKMMAACTTWAQCRWREVGEIWELFWNQNRL